MAIKVNNPTSRGVLYNYSANATSALLAAPNVPSMPR